MSIYLVNCNLNILTICVCIFTFMVFVLSNPCECWDATFVHYIDAITCLKVISVVVYRGFFLLIIFFNFNNSLNLVKLVLRNFVFVCDDPKCRIAQIFKLILSFFSLLDLNKIYFKYFFYYYFLLLFLLKINHKYFQIVITILLINHNFYIFLFA